MMLRTFLLGSFLVAAFPIEAQEEIACPDGAKPNGETTPEVSEAWCELSVDGAIVMHGPYRSWWPNGTLGTSGQYDRGKAVGKWTGWFPSGRLQGEEWFEDGKVVRSRYLNEEGQIVPKLQLPAEQQREE